MHAGGAKAIPVFDAARKSLGARRRWRETGMPPMNPFALLVPLFFAFELWQLYIGERYLGIKQIKAGLDPRELPMPNWLAGMWASGLIAYGGWMILLLFHPLGRAQGAVLLAVTLLGYGLRSATNLKWTLVILTFEGSIRIGMLISLAGMTWRALTR
jgi:hypothetical protein